MHSETARIAKLLTKEVRQFVLAETGKAPMPDSCWSGKWMGVLVELVHDGIHWRKTALCHDVAAYLRAKESSTLAQQLRDDDLEDNG